MEHLLVGASNLRFLYPGLARAIHAAAPGRSVVRVAAGVGRSYYLKAGVPWLRAPAAGASGAIDDFLSASRPGARAALVMDMGNDILYGLPRAALVSPLVTLVGRLARSGVPTLVVPPPLSPGGLSPRRFALVRALYYPSSSVGYIAAREGLLALTRALERLECGPVRLARGLAPHLSPDRIHFAPWRWAVVANALLSGLSTLTGFAYPRLAPLDPLRALLSVPPFRPRRHWRFGRERISPGVHEAAPGKRTILY